MFSIVWANFGLTMCIQHQRTIIMHEILNLWHEILDLFISLKSYLHLKFFFTYKYSCVFLLFYIFYQKISPSEDLHKWTNMSDSNKWSSPSCVTVGASGALLALLAPVEKWSWKKLYVQCRSAGPISGKDIAKRLDVQSIMSFV